MGRGGVRELAGVSLLLFGVIALGCSLLSLAWAPSRAEGRLTDGVPREYSGRTASAESVGEFFSEAPDHVDFEYVEAATRTVSAAVQHGASPVGPTENWLMWAAGVLHPFAAYSQDADRILEHGTGICSDAATALQELLDGVDVESRIVRFGRSHVVLEVLTPTGWVHADADWGVALPMETAALPDHQAEVGAALQSAGWGAPQIDWYIDVVRADHVDRLQPGQRLGETLWLFERMSWWLMWLAPAGAVVLGVRLLRPRPVRESRLVTTDEDRLEPVEV